MQRRGAGGRAPGVAPRRHGVGQALAAPRAQGGRELLLVGGRVPGPAGDQRAIVAAREQRVAVAAPAGGRVAGRRSRPRARAAGRSATRPASRRAGRASPPPARPPARGSRRARAASTSRYACGCMTCSVDAGGRKRSAAFTTSSRRDRPPAAGRRTPRRPVYGNSSCAIRNGGRSPVGWNADAARPPNVSSAPKRRST